MPRIPSITGSNPLPNLPGPVMDRERRPTVDNTQVAGAVGRLAKSSQQPDVPDSLAAPFKALGAVGDAITKAGNVVTAMAEVRQRANTNGQIFDGDQDFTRVQGEFEEWRRKDPKRSPEEWLPEWERRYKELEKRWAGRTDLTPQARGLISQRLQANGLGFTINVRAEADRTLLKKEFDAGEFGLSNSIEAQIPEDFEASIKHMESLGAEPFRVKHWRLKYKQEGDRQKKWAEAEAERTELKTEQTFAIADPIKWQEQNKTPWKGREVLWQRVKNTADAAIMDGRRSAVDEINNAMASGAITVPGEVEAWENIYLTPAIRKEAIESLARVESVEARAQREQNGPVNAVRLRRDAQAYDPKSDPDGLDFFRLKQRLIHEVPEGMREGVIDTAEAKFSNKAAPLRPEVDTYVDKTLDSVFDPVNGVYKYRRKEMVAGPDGVFRATEVEFDPVKREEALEQEAVLRGKLREWAAGNPEVAKDIQQVKKKLGEFMRAGDRAEALSQAMGKATASGESAALLNDNLISSVKALESFIPNAYGDYKQTSVGYGTRAKHPREVLTEAQADARLREELTGHAKNVDRAAQKAGLSLSEGQRNALISFDFNTGKGAHLIQTSGGNLEEIKRRMLLYTKVETKGGDMKDLGGLVKRRKKEVEIFEAGLATGRTAGLPEPDPAQIN